MKRYFKKNYRSVQLIAALATYNMYNYKFNSTDTLLEKAEIFEHFLIKKVRGFYFAKLNGVEFFLNKLLTKFNVNNSKIFELLIFSLHHNKDYQKVMNYIYENFKYEELKKAYNAFQNTDAKIDTFDRVKYVYDKL